jgi:hypothetical protein
MSVASEVIFLIKLNPYRFVRMAANAAVGVFIDCMQFMTAPNPEANID